MTVGGKTTTAVGAYLKLTTVPLPWLAAVGAFAFLMVFWQEILKAFRFRRAAPKKAPA